MKRKPRIIKRPVTLLEVLISLALTVIILTTLTFFYRQVGIIGVEVDHVIADNFRMRYVETRLARIFPKIVAANDKKKDFVFFSVGDEGVTKPGSESLIFTFDNAISLDKDVSNHALGRIYLDNDGNLMLAYWPSPKRWENGTLPEMKKEVLMEGVENVRFEFYIPPEKSAKPVNEPNPPTKTPTKTQEKEKPDAVDNKPKPEPRGDWRRQSWLKEYESLPAMIRMIVTMPKDQKAMVFAFPIANGKDHVIYD